MAEPSARHGRWAVAAMFLANGFIVGSWAPQIPLVLTRLDITPATLGVLILIFGGGAITSMPWCGYLMTRYGTRAVLRVFSVVCCFGLPAVLLAPNVWFAAVALYLMGALIGGMDVSMNANAVAVERKLGRAIMSSSHGFWSLGGFAGGGVGGLAIQHFGYLVHGGLVTAVVLALVLAARPRLVSEDGPVKQEGLRLALPRNPAIYAVGVIALFSMVPEGAVLDWAAIHLQRELGASIATASLAFAFFSAAMAAMRFAGDTVRNRFGAVTTLRVSSLVAAAGMLLAGLSPMPWLAIAAFALCGTGIANLVPIAFSAAGNQPGMSSGAGMSVVTTMGYSGILVAPSAIGYAGQRTGFGAVFVVLSLLLLVVLVMASLARAADFAEAQPVA